MKINKLVLVSTLAGIAMLTSCNQLPSYPASDVEEGSRTFTINSKSVTVKKIDAKLGANFIRGFDASAVNNAGTGNYTDAKGNVSDIFEVLPEYGINYIRLRVWNNPASSKNPDVPGASNKEVVVEQAKRVKANDMKYLLDFHYSDYWADPGKQLIPEAWLNTTTSDGMAENIYSYTKEVLQTLKDADAEPNMIQIGNEINTGLLIHETLSSSGTTKDADSAISGRVSSSDYANYVKYLAAGIKAAREVCPDSKIMLHLAKGGADLNWLLKIYKDAGLDYDVIGLSYYPQETSHGTIANLGKFIAQYKADYGKKVVVAETNFHYESTSGYDETAKKNLVDANGNTYGDIEVNANGVVNSLQNQVDVLRAVMEVTAANGGSGVFVWGGECKGLWNSMIDGSGAPLASMGVFTVSGK